MVESAEAPPPEEPEVEEREPAMEGAGEAQAREESPSAPQEVLAEIEGVGEKTKEEEEEEGEKEMTPPTPEVVEEAAVVGEEKEEEEEEEMEEKDEEEE